jgi:2-polyprenyl-6-methoxyphenol hydroxylase-like FAD-dependent oxidoreductase
MNNKNIAVIGAGFAGLASAIMLARDGHHVTVFEKFSEPASVGAGVLIQPTGLAAMRALGIETEIVRQGAKIDWLYGVTPKQKPVIDIHYQSWRPEAYGVGLHRGVLFESLWNHAKAAGVQIITGTEVSELSALQSQFALTVIADGAHSKLRDKTGLKAQHRDYPWGAFWAVLPDIDDIYSKQNALLQWYDRAHKMMGIMPTGQLPNSTTKVVSIFWSLHSNQLANWHAKGLDAWKAEVLQLNPACEALLAQITDAGQLTWAHYADVVMPQYHTDNCVVIGDAAHATSPQLGQGTNMALLDAVTLSRCVQSAASIAEALAQYTKQRKPHLHYYGAASRLLTPLFQSDQTLLPWLRDKLLPVTAKWPIIEDAHLQTLVGVRGGWLSWRDANQWLKP